MQTDDLTTKQIELIVALDNPVQATSSIQLVGKAAAKASQTDNSSGQLKGDPGSRTAPRLDQYLVEQFSHMTRSHIQKLISDGMVLVDNVKQKASHRLKDGQKIVVHLPPAKPLAIIAEDIPIEILYEDEYLAVVNKPAGMITHPGAGVHSGTLVHALMHHMRGSLSGISGTMRPGIVHRLDKDTSGILVVAKQDVAHQNLAKQIQAKVAKRIYLSVLEGQLSNDSGTVNASLGRHPSNRTKMAIVEHGRKAVSHYQVLKRASSFILAEVKLETGRTHQIRVHMNSLNCPVVGDLVYNTKTTGTLAYRKRSGLVGQALHAYKLSFCHPVTNELLEFKAKVPDDLQKLIDGLFS